MSEPEDANSRNEEVPSGKDQHDNTEQRGLYRVPRRQAPLRPDLQLSEVKRGVKPGSRYVRITPSTQQTLRRMAPAHLQATAVLLRPRTLPGQLWTGLKRVLARLAPDVLAGDP